MKQTLFIRTILSSLLAVACLALSGSPAFASGIVVNYPSVGTTLDSKGNLIPIGSLSENTVNSSGNVNSNVYGGYTTSGNVTNNTVNISGGSVGKIVSGGYTASGNVTNNTVNVLSGIINGIQGGSSAKGSCSNNVVNVLGGSILDDVFGASSYGAGGSSTGNKLNIFGGSVIGDVIGGWTFMGNATHNTVVLGSGAKLSKDTMLYGGYRQMITGGDTFTGNKLILNNFSGTVKEMGNFEFIEITTSGKEEDMIIIAGDKVTDLSNVKLSITFSGMDRPAEVGDNIYLIRNDKGIITKNMTLNQNGQQKVIGTAYIYDLEFGTDSNSINATISNVTAIIVDKTFNDHSKALAEGRVASMAHLNMGGDLIAEQGMDQAIHAGRASGTPGKKFSLFAAMNATSSKYDTGSHIDLYGYSALAGAAITPPALSSLTAGLFAESGWGHYGSMSEFEDGTVLGAGRSKYYGGGLMTQYDFSKMGVSGLSVDASFRAGKADTSFNSGDLPDSHYDLSAPYYGIHAGVNYTRQLTAKLKMANYARFFWTHLDGDTAPIDNSEFSFRTMDSQRIKAGTRFLYEACSGITPYAGASYEWECSGTARAIVDGANGMAAPSLRGGTGTGELGMIYQPMAESPFWVDLSAQGHVGERQGVSGSVRVRAEF